MLTVHGTPVTQGSMRALAAGVIRREHGSQLEAWRDAITRGLLKLCGGSWIAETGPVRLEAVFTIKRPPSQPTRAFPHVKPDVDKLLRALQDALSPRLKKGESAKSGTVPTSRLSRFQLLADDSLIVDSHPVKTYPAPAHTHPWALDRPGVVLRVSPASACIAPMPGCSLRPTLSPPGTQP